MSHASRPLALAIALLAIGLLRPATAAHAAPVPCPTSAASYYGQPTLVLEAATYDSTVASSPDCSYHLAYDLVAGTSAMRQCGSLGTTFVRASDAFDVVGVPAGTPVSLTAFYVVDDTVWTAGCGGSGCGGNVTVRIQQGAAYDERVHDVHLFGGSAGFHDVLSLPITIVAGQPVVIDCILSGHRNPGGSHDSSAWGTLSFSGLSAGTGVISCQGFAGAVVPARPPTWGALKLRYR